MQQRSLVEESMNTFPVGCAFRRTMNSIAIHRLWLLLLIATVTAFTVSALAQDIQKALFRSISENLCDTVAAV